MESENNTSGSDDAAGIENPPSTAPTDGATARQPDWTRSRQTTHECADLDEATPGKTAQRETEITEVGGEDETSRPNI